MLSQEEIIANWVKIQKVVSHYLSDERAEAVLNMYNSLEDIMCIAPSSAKKHYYNPFPGGYVDHALRTTKAALKIHSLWQELGSNANYTTEELVFSALHHDLGKLGLGDPNEAGLVAQEDAWRKKNLGELFSINNNIQYMSVQDRTMFILNRYGIKITENEFLGIKLSNGLFDDSAKNYFYAATPEKKLRTELPYIINQAFVTASEIEYQKYQKISD